jgi:hypothetical protein
MASGDVSPETFSVEDDGLQLMIISVHHDEFLSGSVFPLELGHRGPE